MGIRKFVESGVFVRRTNTSYFVFRATRETLGDYLIVCFRRWCQTGYQKLFIYYKIC